MPRARKSGTARAGAAPRARASSDATQAADPRAKLIDAAFDLAEKRGWRGLGMGEIAKAAGVSLASAYALFPTKVALLAGFGRRLNEAMLAAGEAEGSSREKLFELLMRRFDALKPRRAALRAIARDGMGDPLMLCGVPVFLNGMAWTLEAAGISAAGWGGPARVFVLSGIYLAAFRVFIDDDSEDLSKTMAALDRRLEAAPLGSSRGESPSPAAS